VTVLRQESAFPQQALATGASPRRRWGLAGFRSFWLIFQHGPTAFRTICARAADDRIPCAAINSQRCLGPYQMSDDRAAIRRTAADQAANAFGRTSLCTHPQQAPVQLQQWRRALTVVPDLGGNRRSMRELPINHGPNAGGRVSVPWFGFDVALDTDVMWGATRSVKFGARRVSARPRSAPRRRRPSSPLNSWRKRQVSLLGGAKAFRPLFKPVDFAGDLRQKAR